MSAVNLIYIFSFIGVLDTLYLSYHTLTKTDVACWFFPKEWCRKVQYSKQSRMFFGIPNSFLGLGMYLTLLILTYSYQGGNLAFWPIQAVILVGLLFSSYFIYVQAFVLKAFCTWCVVSAVNFVVMFLAAFFLN